MSHASISPTARFPKRLKLIEMVRKIAREERRSVCILGDLQGPKIRTGRLKNRIPVQLKAGQRLTITPRDILGTSAVIATTFPTLAENLEPGARILLSDGLIELRVLQIPGEDVDCEVINGGMLGEHKGINLPGIAVRVPSLTEKDEEDLEFGMKHGVDAIAVSFVRTAEDVRHVKFRVAALGLETWIIAKLEKPQAIENLEAILENADGIMVARGDLGVEMPPEKVPAIQKHVIRRAAEYRKPVITATQMLESMIENPRPTRAEASDVANAIYDGTDAVMLSAETAAGKYPVEAVKMMAKIVSETESNLRDTGGFEIHHTTASAFPSRKLSASQPLTLPKTLMSAPSPFSLNRAPPPVSSRSTAPSRPSTRSPASTRSFTACLCSGASTPSNVPSCRPPNRWSTTQRPPSSRAASSSRRKFSASSPARRLAPARRISSASTSSATALLKPRRTITTRPPGPPAKATVEPPKGVATQELAARTGNLFRFWLKLCRI